MNNANMRIFQQCSYMQVFCAFSADVFINACTKSLTKWYLFAFEQKHIFSQPNLGEIQRLPSWQLLIMDVKFKQKPQLCKCR